MKHEGLLPRAQQPASCSYSEPYDLFQALQSYSFKIHFKVILHLRLDIPSGFYLSPQKFRVQVIVYKPKYY
jgi:hypothetical protein